MMGHVVFFGQKNRARQIRIDRVAAAAATNNTQLGPNKKESAVGFEWRLVTESTNEIWWSFPPVFFFRIELSEHLARHTNNTKENVGPDPSEEKFSKAPWWTQKTFFCAGSLAWTEQPAGSGCHKSISVKLRTLCPLWFGAESTDPHGCVTWCKWITIDLVDVLCCANANG